MKKIWEIINEKEWKKDIKYKLFVGVNTAAWVIITFLLCLLVGVLFGGINAYWMKITVIAVGYIGIGIGFFGSVFYILRNTEYSG